MPEDDPLRAFHPAVAAWFRRTLGAPTEPQRRGWRAIRAGHHALIAAPTGAGKTLAAFLAAIDHLVQSALAGELAPTTRVLYLSPLKALSNDVERNLQAPLLGIAEEGARLGLDIPVLQASVRTGDTTPAARAAMIKRPPHLLVTTPESLYILLTSAGGRRALAGVRAVIVDEIHALIGDKRGAHLALSLERLQALVDAEGGALQRIGLSATQRPIDAAARFLVGHRADATPCEIIDLGRPRELDLDLELPPSPLSAVTSNAQWDELAARIAELSDQHRTTLVFVNTRRLAERLARLLGERLGRERVAAHHGSLAREVRQRSELRLKSGELRVLVATASLELGIDIGAVELVCQIGSPRAISTLLQRVGRSRHNVGGVPKGRLFPLSRDDLVECAALLVALRTGQLEHLEIPHQPQDILAQQIVAMAAVERLDEADLLARIRRADPYRDFSTEQLDALLTMLADGFSTKRGRRGALIHRDRVHGVIRGGRGAALAAILNGGAIPETADYEVIREPDGGVVGSVHEDFAIDSRAGDVFQLGTTSWKIRKIDPGKVRVEDAHGAPPTMPVWFGEAPSRSAELSAAVAELRDRVAEQLLRSDPEQTITWLLGHPFLLQPEAARQLVDYLAAAQAALGAMPSQGTIVAERFFDEAGGMQLVLHAPFGGRVNRAWGLALRKRFCRSFNFELQAAATDDAIVLSLGAVHSFPLADVFSYLHGPGLQDILTQALLDAPVFTVRWRWNAGRALAVPRRRAGRKVPPQIQRMLAEDLAAVVFPDQGACLENIAGDREIPDHPLVHQTIHDCLHEAMDLTRLRALIDAITGGLKRLHAVDLPQPSPMAHELLRARPYAFLDDAPLEERRAAAVALRRHLGPEEARGLGALDPAVIDELRRQIWPKIDDPDELHDALIWLAYLTEQEFSQLRDGPRLLDKLTQERRAARLFLPSGAALIIAAERQPQHLALPGPRRLDPPLDAPPALDRPWEPDLALIELIRSRLEGLGPASAARLAHELELPVAAAAAALLALEAEGFVLRGHFSPASEDEAAEEFCERGLLARIHRGTLHRLRQEIAPVSVPEYIRFLLAWHQVSDDPRPSGPHALALALSRLEGFEAPAAAWEAELLPARLRRHDPAELDALTHSGALVWARLGVGGGKRASAPVRTTPIVLLPRENAALWLSLAPKVNDPGELSPAARALYQLLTDRGALFFGELLAHSRLLRAQVEQALAELVARGLASSDGFFGIRGLIAPKHGKQRQRRQAAAHPVRPGFSPLERAGRWSRVPLPDPSGPQREDPEHALEAVARAFLRRYGVVFRGVLARERASPPWRSLLRIYRRLEARGELRGGYFVEGAAAGGEQFAVPEAIGLLRAERRRGPDDRLVCVAAADPLCLLGVLTPGERLPTQLGARLLYRGGVPAATLLPGGQIQRLIEPTRDDAESLTRALIAGP